MNITKSILLILFITACSLLHAQPYPKEPGVIRLLTYNTHYCKGGSDPGSINEENTRKFAQVIKSLDSDLVSLQELDSACNSRGRRNQLKQIADFSEIPFEPIFGAAASYDGGKIGCGILVRKTFPIKRIKKTPLAGDEGRILVRVDLENFIFMGTHLDLNDSKRIMSAGSICSEIAYVSKPAFLGGDLNDSFEWKSGAFANAFNNTFEIASSISGSSLPGRTDGTQSLIDYILLRQGTSAKIKIVNAQIVRGVEIEGKVVDLATISDHYPVFIDIEVPEYSNIESNIDNRFSIYPNPAKNKINILSDKCFSRIEIFSATGKKMIGLQEENIQEIPTSSLAPGVYILKAYTNKDSFESKLLIR